MLILYLSRGHEALIDDDDSDLGNFKWSYVKKHKIGYASRSATVGGKRVTIRLHQVIARRKFGSIPDGIKVDHENGNSLDNRRKNIRLATQKQNLANRGPDRDNVTGYKGVSFRGSLLSKPYVARIDSCGDRNFYARKRFDTALEAAKQYDVWAKEVFGEFAWLNFPEKPREPLK